VAIHSYSHEDVSSVDDLSKTFLQQLEQFFVSYNKLRGKKFRVKGCHGPKRALAVINKGIKAFEKKNA